MNIRLVSTCFVMLSCSLLFSCAIGVKTTVIVDSDGNGTIHRLSTLFPEVDRQFVGPHGNIGVAIEMFVTKDQNDTTFRLQAIIMSPREWTIRAGDTISLFVENKGWILYCEQPRIAIPNDGPTLGGTFYPVSGGLYLATRSMLQAVADSRAVVIRIHTKEGVVTGRMKNSDISAIGKFRDTYFP